MFAKEEPSTTLMDLNRLQPRPIAIRRQGLSNLEDPLGR